MDAAIHSRLGQRRVLVTVLLILGLIISITAASINVPRASGSPDPPFSGTVTVIEKPGSPIRIDDGNISIGATRNFLFQNLEEGHKYHAYFYGNWTDPVNHLTDYDIYIYERGNGSTTFLSSHTESAGYPEQPANNPSGQYFIPSATGDYYFSINNDLKESSATLGGTLNLVEHIDLNQWYTKYLDENKSGLVNNWIYEFETDADHIRVDIVVPDTLDMYEARVYVMGNPDADKGELVNGISLAWEEGLYGYKTGIYGGVNIDPQGFRHIDMSASCERNGEDMTLKFDAPLDGRTLYYLVFIAEYGGGNIDFIVQTDFSPPTLALIDPPTTAQSDTPIELYCLATDSSEIDSMRLRYSVNGNESWRTLWPHEEDDGVYSVYIPAFEAGTTVNYNFKATDVFGNTATIYSHYKIREGRFPGNVTVVGTPNRPMKLPKGQILPRENWTFSYDLEANRSYHAYLFGEWVDPVIHKTDYDVHVYKKTKKSLNLISSHTEGGGLIEQISNDGQGRYFVPSKSGEYYFEIRNDWKESSASKSATLMVVEHILPNEWHTRDISAPITDEDVPNFDLVYEFEASTDRVHVEVEVPSDLDMYETRLYVVANPDGNLGEFLNGIPIAWEDALWGKRDQSGVYGGFNLDRSGYRNPNAMATGRYAGEDLVIDYYPAVDSVLQYYLVLMAETGSGTVNFTVKTDYDPPSMRLLDPPSVVENFTRVDLKCKIADESGLAYVYLWYSVDGGASEKLAVNDLGDGTYSVEIPPYIAGTDVEYYFEASDLLGNTGRVNGEYSVMGSPSLAITLDKSRVNGGDIITLTGQFNLPSTTIQIIYRKVGKESSFNVKADKTGAFTHTFKPNEVGDWTAQAAFGGDAAYYAAKSEKVSFKVVRPATILTSDLSSEVIELGQEVNITGRFSLPRIAIEVFITCSNEPNSTTLLALTEPDGNYSLIFKPETLGTWQIQARVRPDALEYSGASSFVQELVVKKPTLISKAKQIPATLSKPPFVYGVGGVMGSAAGGFLFYVRRRGGFGITEKIKARLKSSEKKDEPSIDIDL